MKALIEMIKEDPWEFIGGVITFGGILFMGFMLSGIGACRYGQFKRFYKSSHRGEKTRSGGINVEDGGSFC